jgi:hypothetical protein
VIVAAAAAIVAVTSFPTDLVTVAVEVAVAVTALPTLRVMAAVDVAVAVTANATSLVIDAVVVTVADSSWGVVAPAAAVGIQGCCGGLCGGRRKTQYDNGPAP